MDEGNEVAGFLQLNLLNFLMHGMLPHKGIVFFLFQPLRMSLGIFSGGVPGWRDPRFSCLCALDGNNANFPFFLGHSVAPPQNKIRS